MINQIQSVNNLVNINAHKYNAAPSLNTSFCSNESINPLDTFENQPKEKKESKTNSELGMIAITGASATFAGLAHHKMGTIIKSVGEKVPLSPWGRIKKVFELTSKDPLTGLYNRATLLASIDKGYKNAMKNNKPFSVAMLDMDNFKGINEVFDHDKGDLVLKRIAANINEVAKKHGVKGYRYGGEEFVIVMPEHDANSSKTIIEEIAKTIKEDKTIQDYMPEFIENANKDINFVTSKLKKFDSIFPKLRHQKWIGDYRALANETISIIEEHIQKYDPSDRKALDELVTKLKTAKNRDLHKLLSVKTETGDHSTLGKELNKIYSQYSASKNDLTKWVDHLDQHKMFTVSGGIVNLTNTNSIKDSETSIKLADAALKSAKENGKNTIIIATDDLINKTIDKINKQSN